MILKGSYHSSVEGLRVVAILGVIAIHTTTRILEWSYGEIESQQFSFFINQISRFAVPMFFMISGYVLELSYTKHSSYFVFLRKRLNKIILPYFFWSFIYYFFVYRSNIFTFWKTLVLGEASYQLYFIPSLLILYVLFPFFHNLFHYLIRSYILLILAIIQLSLLSYDYYVSPLPFSYPISIVLLNFFAFILGMIAFRLRIQILNFCQKHIAKIVLATIVVGFLVSYEAKWLYTTSKNYLYYYSSWKPLIFLYTLCLAAILFVFFENNRKLDKVITFLSDHSFGVFFVHVLVLELASNSLFRYLFVQSNYTFTGQVAFFLVFFVAVSALSYLITYMFHRFPRIAKLTA